MTFRSAFMASIIATISVFGAGQALAGDHASNTWYYEKIRQPGDMPRPSARNLPPTPAAGKVNLFGCKTNADGDWEIKTSWFGEKYNCDYFIFDASAVQGKVTQQQLVAATPAVQTSVVDELCFTDRPFCTLRSDQEPQYNGKYDPYYQKSPTECVVGGQTCKWINTKIRGPNWKPEEVQQQLSTPDPCRFDRKNPVPIVLMEPGGGYRIACASEKYVRDMHSRYGPAYGVSYPGQFRGPGDIGFGFYFGSAWNYGSGRPYHEYRPSSWDGPSVCSRNGEYRQNGGRAFTRGC